MDESTLNPDPNESEVDILHLDMDGFFASVEVRDDPSLVGLPVIVGGAGPRGVVASASYEARVYGIRSAMPTAQARQLCPHAVIKPGRFDVYGATSKELNELMQEVTPFIEPIALDEAFLDVSGAHGVFGPSEVIARTLRARVIKQLGLDCSVGVGSSKLFAKLASKAAKPRVSPTGVLPGPGVLLIRRSDELDFLHAHPIRALPGIGPKTGDRLARLGISTVGELSTIGCDRLIRLFGKSHGQTLFDLAAGKDSRAVVTERLLRSVGHEETFDADDYELESLMSCARRLATSVATRCRSAEVCFRTIVIKVRYGDFTTITRSRTVGSMTTANEIASVACELLTTIEPERGVRLLGVSVTGIEPLEANSGTQLALFSDGANQDATKRSEEVALHEELESVADEIRRRFGSSAITSASSKRSDESKRVR